MLLLWPGQPLPGALMWFVSHQIHFDRSRQHQPVLQFIPPRDPGRRAISGTDLSFHVWRRWEWWARWSSRCPKNTSQMSMLPQDGQVTELQEETDTQAGLSAGPGATLTDSHPPPCCRSPQSIPFSLWKGFYESLVIGEFEFSLTCLSI